MALTNSAKSGVKLFPNLDSIPPGPIEIGELKLDIQSIGSTPILSCHVCVALTQATRLIQILITNHCLNESIESIESNHPSTFELTSINSQQYNHPSLTYIVHGLRALSS